MNSVDVKLEVKWAEGFELESLDKYRFRWLYICTYWLVKYQGNYVGTFRSKRDAEEAITLYKCVSRIKESNQ